MDLIVSNGGVHWSARDTGLFNTDLLITGDATARKIVTFDPAPVAKSLVPREGVKQRRERDWRQDRVDLHRLERQQHLEYGADTFLAPDVYDA